jgi:AraC-like DNA-binding protein
MRIEKTLPAETLRDYFEEYYFIEMGSNGSVKTIPVIDDCSYDFIFFREAHATLNYGRPTSALRIRNSIFTVHNLTPPYSISFKGSLTFFTIKVKPWYNGFFFSDLSESGVPDASSLFPNGKSFFNQVFELSDPEDMFDLANEQLKNNRPETSKNVLLVKSICEHIIERSGMISVNELSEYFDKSRQYLNKTFKQHVLYSLKKYITTVKILDLVKLKSKQPEISLTELAHQYKYFDQAHFIHDFKSVCGVIPSHFFENLPEFLLRH